MEDIESLPDSNSTEERNARILLGLALVIFLSLQIALNLFNPIDSRSDHAESLAHISISGTRFLEDPSCSQNSEFSPRSDDSCWHYPSRYALESIFASIPSMFMSGFVPLKIYSVLLTMVEAVLIYSIIRTNGREMMASACATAYLCIPSVFYYAQMPQAHVAVLSVLIACRWTVPHIMSPQEMSHAKLLGVWTSILLLPALSPLIAFAWAGFALAAFLASERCLWQRLVIGASLCISPVLSFLSHNALNEKLSSVTGYMSTRFQARSDPTLFLDPAFALTFIERIAMHIGPIGLLVVLACLIHRHSFSRLSPTTKGVLIGLASFGFWSPIVFNAGFVICCRYFAYPLAAAIVVIAGNTPIMIRWNGRIAALLVASLIIGMGLHGLSTNYDDWTLQEHAHMIAEEDPDATVLIDDGLSRYNAFKWALPDGWIQVGREIAIDDFNETILSAGVDYLIVSEDFSQREDVRSFLSDLGFCSEELPVHPGVLEINLNGHLDGILPAESWRRCG